MECRITSTSRQRRKRGFTLTEFLVAMGIGSLILTAVASISLYSGRSLSAMMNYVDLDSDSRNALDVLTRDVRQSNRLTTFATNSITLEDFDTLPLTFTWNPTTRKFTRTKSGVTTTLLTECDILTFSMFQRNPVNGTYDQYPAASVATAKLISVSWTCSRTLMGSKSNTESVQTAKIVIRKQ